MGSHVGRGMLAVVAAIAVTLVVFRASAAEVPAASGSDMSADAIEAQLVEALNEVEEEEDFVWVYSPSLGERLGATAHRQVEILRKLPDDVGKAILVDLPGKSRAFGAMSNVENPRAVSIALADDFDALGTQASGVVRGVSAIGTGVGDLLGQMLPGKSTSGVGLLHLAA